MRVLIVCNEFPPVPHGGIGSAVFDLAGELYATGVEVEVAGVFPHQILDAFQLGPEDERYGFRVHRLRATRLPLPYSARVFVDRFNLRRWIIHRHRREAYDIVFTDDYEGWLPGGAPLGSKLVVRLNGSNLVYDSLLDRPGDRWLWNCERRMMNRADAWIGVSRFFLEETKHRVIPRPGIRLAVLPNPVDTGLFTPSTAEDLAVPGRIVFHNTLNERKGIIELFRALPEVIRAVPQTHLEIYGGDPSQEETRRSLMALLPPGCVERVKFMGHADRFSVLPRALERASVACYPSHLEAFGIAPVEAMALKRITIYTTTGPGPEIVEDQVEGLLCPPRDYEALARVLIQALRLPPARRHAMGEAARAKAVAEFDCRAVTRRYLDLFRSLVASSS